jgi:ammonia channel protein AmtB
VLILWFGWYGCNAGSTLGISTPELAASVAEVTMNTTLAAAAGGLAFFATDGTEVCNFFDFFVPYWRCVIRSLLT